VAAHPSPTEIQALVRGGISKRRSKQVLVHIFRGCKECLAILKPELPFAFGAGPGEVTPETMAPYSEPVERAIAKVSRKARYLQKEQRQIPQAAEWLGQEGLEDVFAPPPRLSRLAFYEALLEKSWALRRESPKEMVRYARAAALVATTLDKRWLGKKRWFDLSARAWGELANAYRAADDLDKAGEAFDRAFELLRCGTGDKTIEARLHDLQASYYGTRRWFKLALKSLDAVHALHVRKGDSQRAGRALIKKALYTIYSGQPELALSLLDEALAMIDEERDPELTCDAMHNRLLALVDARRFPEARKVLFLNGVRFKAVAGKIHRLKIDGLRARIDAGMGSLTSAEHLFLKVRQGMEAAGMGFHAALISLELSLIYKRQGRIAESRKEATEAAEVFRTLGVHRELLVALGVVQRSFEVGLATVPLLESLVEYVRRAEHDPGLRFEPRF
jgi:tetratricopeptide (TPR) repeat protein